MWRLKILFNKIKLNLNYLLGNIRSTLINYLWYKRLRSLPKHPHDKILLHIGCGEINAPYFINIDARPLPHVHIVTTNLKKFKMIPDNAVDFIYMSHILEHISHRDTIDTLNELRRILKPNGTLRISVPDFDKMIHIYQSTNNCMESMEQALMGGQDYPYNYHYAVFNKEHLSNKMRTAGFTNIREWDPNNCEYHDFDDWANGTICWNGREYPISLNLEATKPL